MSRMDRDAITNALTAKLGATADPEGGPDLIASQGRIAIVPTPADIDPAIARLRPLPGYRWLAINGGDLFSASPKTIGTKIGIIDHTGKVLKAADLPRPKV
jgi:hypothetical protein